MKCVFQMLRAISQLTLLWLCFSVIFAHASCRFRNMKNKMGNVMDGSAMKRSFMGILLNSLGQQEEPHHKLNNFLDGN